MTYREEKISELVHKLAAEFIARESNLQSMITVTAIRMFDNNKRANVLVTVFPDDKEKTALEFLKRKRSDFREFVKEKSAIGLIPFFDFEIDIGEKNRQRIDELSNEDRKRGVDNGSANGIE